MKPRMIDGNILIPLDRTGYILFEAVARVNDDQQYIVNLRLDNIITISGEAMCAHLSLDNVVKCELQSVILELQQIVNNLEKYIG